MTFPLIGITTREEDEKNRYTLAARYVASVRRAGGQPVLLPPGEPNVEQLIRRLDGVLLSGGGDVDPLLYHGRADATIYGVNPKRDQIEIQIVRYALSHAYPLLGICRGIQIMNVAMGGTLIEHLPAVVGEKVKHQLPERETSTHPVALRRGTRLAEIFEAEQFDVPSSHHQAIRQLASSLTDVAHAKDGIIEAVEIADHPFFIGVQWHPELSDNPLQQKLFQAFMTAASRTASLSS